MTTTGGQTYNDPVTLGANTTLSGTAIAFNGTLNSDATPRTLLVNASAQTTFAGLVGGVNALASLATDAAGLTLISGGGVTTTGSQTYSDPVTLGANTTLSGTAIAFNGTLNSDATPRTLLVNASAQTTFAGLVGGVSALASLSTDAAGTTVISGGGVTTTGSQTYNDPVTLTANTTLSGTAIAFNGTLNSDATPRTLLVNASAQTTLGGPVGGTSPLASLTTNAAGTMLISGGSVTTTGGQTYNDPVTLGANTTLSGTAIAFNGTLNSDATPRTLLVNASAQTTFAGLVGGVNALASLATDAAGLTLISGGGVTTTGSQTYSDPVTLGANTTLSGTAIAFNGTLNSDATPRTLLVNASAQTTFGGLVGGVNALASLSTDAAGTTLISGGGVTTTGGQTYNDPVTLGANATLNGTAIAFNSTLNSDATPRTLLVNASAQTTFAGLVGAVNALASLATDAAGSTLIGGGGVTTTDGQTYNDPVRLGQDTTLTSTAAGNIEFHDKLDSAAATNRNLTVNTAGNVDFGDGGTDYVGSQVALASVTTDAGGATRIQMSNTAQPSVRTTGAQSYGDQLVLRSDLRLRSESGGTIWLRNKVDSFDAVPRALTIQTGGFTDFGDGGADLVGSAQPLASLTTDDFAGSVATDRTRFNILTNLAGGPASVRTTGNQNYGDDVVLLAATWLQSTGGGLDFAAGASGAFQFIAEAPTTVRYAGIVDVGASSETRAPVVTIDGESTIEGAVPLLDDVLRVLVSAGVPAMQLNGAAAMLLPELDDATPGVKSLTFNGGAGDDRLNVELANDNGPLPLASANALQGLFFHGGSGSEDPGLGDLLSVRGLHGLDNVIDYRPSATTDGNGTLLVGAGADPRRRIEFAALEPVDISGMAKVTFTPGALVTF